MNDCIRGVMGGREGALTTRKQLAPTKGRGRGGSLNVVEGEVTAGTHTVRVPGGGEEEHKGC